MKKRDWERFERDAKSSSRFTFRNVWILILSCAAVLWIGFQTSWGFLDVFIRRLGAS